MKLHQAIKLAAVAHADQVDKQGQPYIRHPLRVMEACAPDVELMAVAVLHDVLEDTFVSPEYLSFHYGASAEFIGTLLTLTRGHKEPYMKYIERIATHPIARRVKLADLEDNMSDARNPLPHSKETVARLKKYRKAHSYLLDVEIDEDALNDSSPYAY